MTGDAAPGDETARETADDERLFSRFGVITTAGNRDLERRAREVLGEGETAGDGRPSSKGGEGARRPGPDLGAPVPWRLARGSGLPGDGGISARGRGRRGSRGSVDRGDRGGRWVEGMETAGRMDKRKPGGNRRNEGRSGETYSSAHPASSHARGPEPGRESPAGAGAGARGSSQPGCVVRPRGARGGQAGSTRGPPGRPAPGDGSAWGPGHVERVRRLPSHVAPMKVSA